MLQLLNTEIARLVPSDAGNTHFLRVCLSCLNILQQIFPAAKDQLANLLEELFTKITSVASKKNLKDVLADKVARQLLINLISKYNIFLSSVSISQLTRSNQAISTGSSFFEKTCKWSVSDFSQRFSTCLVQDNELTVMQVKELIQLPF